MSLPNVLVTGSAGHLGHALMLELPSRGYSPIGIDILTSEHTSFVGSISDREFVAGIFERYHSIRHVLHTATLHKPHVGSHSKQDFVTTNIQGTLVLLEEASKTGRIDSFIFASTTSNFGRALLSKPGTPAAWIDESVVPMPKNIYGATKIAAEDICQLIHRETNMPILVLRISRFFPEEDDSEAARLEYDDDNLKVCELTYRRVDVADVVSAHVCAMERAKAIGWGKYIISAPPPFKNDDASLAALDGRALDVLQSVRPEHARKLLDHGWVFLDRLDRVYDSGKAVNELGWEPKYTFEHAVDHVSQGLDWRSDLAVRVGKRGYHDVPTGVYTS